MGRRKTELEGIEMPKENLKEVTTINMVDAVEQLCSLIAAYPNSSLNEWPMESRDLREQARRTLADGFRFHSGATGIVTGDQ